MIVTQFDNSFLPWGICLVKSIAKHEPDLKVIIAGVNFTNETIKKLESLHKHIFIHNTKIEYAGEQVRLAGPNATWKVLMQNRVTKIIQALNYIGTVIVVDADVILNKPLTDVYSKMKNKSVGFCITKGHTDNKQIHASFMSFNLSKIETLVFIEEYNEIHDNGSIFITDGKPEKYCIKHKADQLKLFELYKKYPDFNYELLDFYIYNGFNTDATVWSGHKGNKHRNLKTFQRKTNG